MEAVVVRVGDDTARGRSCSISLVAEAAQEMATTVKERKLTFTIMCARAVRFEYAVLEFWSLEGGGGKMLALTRRCFCKCLSICLL